MPRYISPTGQPCSADEAAPRGVLRDGYRQLIGAGDYVGFDISLCDAAPASRAAIFLKDAAPGTLDAAIEAGIRDAARRVGKTPEAWLATRTDTQIKDFVAGATDAFNSTISRGGFNMDHGRALAAARMEDAYQATKPALNAWRGQDAASDLNEDAAYERGKVALNSWRDGSTPVDALRHLRHQG